MKTLRNTNRKNLIRLTTQLVALFRKVKWELYKIFGIFSHPHLSRTTMRYCCNKTEINLAQFVGINIQEDFSNNLPNDLANGAINKQLSLDLCNKLEEYIYIT